MAATGYKQKVRWAAEVPNHPYGSYIGAMNRSLGLVQSVTPGEKNNLIKVRTLGGNRDYNNIIPGKFEVSGSMEYLLQKSDFIRMAIGEDTATTTTIDSGPRVDYPCPTAARYLHVMGSADSPGINDFPSFQLELTDFEESDSIVEAGNKVNLRRTYVGCRVNSLTLSATIDEPVKISVDWLGKRVIVSSSDQTYSTENTEEPFVFYQGMVYQTSAEATAGDTRDVFCAGTYQHLGLVNNFDLTINNNAEAVWYICGTTTSYDSIRSAKQIYPKGRDYELKLGMHYQDRTMYERFLGAVNATADQASFTKPQIVMDFVRSGEIGSAIEPVSSPDYIRMVAASVVFDDMSINAAPEDIVGNDTSVFVKSLKFYAVDDIASYGGA